MACRPLGKWLLVLLLLVCSRAQLSWLFGGRKAEANAEVSLADSMMLGKWTFEMRRHESSAVGLNNNVAAHKVSLALERGQKQGEILVLDTKKRRARFTLEMKTASSGVIKVPSIIFPQPNSKTLSPFFASSDTEDLDEFEEETAHDGSTAPSGTAKKVLAEFLWEDEEDDEHSNGASAGGEDELDEFTDDGEGPTSSPSPKGQQKPMSDLAAFQFHWQDMHHIAAGHFIAPTKPDGGGVRSASSNTAPAPAPISAPTVGFYQAVLSFGRVVLTVSLEPLKGKGKRASGSGLHDAPRTIIVLTGVRSGLEHGESGSNADADAGADSGGDSGKGRRKKSSWLVSYGPTAIIIGFFLYQWAQSWAKSNPTFQKMWKLAEEEAKRQMPEAYAKAEQRKKGQ